MSGYDPKVTPWAVKAEPLPTTSKVAQMAFLLRFAILAPSTHNTQPWKFAIGPLGHEDIFIYADWSRWLNVADADQRELRLSLGCALENLLVAAEHYGFAHQVRYFPRPVDETLVAQVRLSEGGAPSEHRKGLFDAIPARHTNHQRYARRMVEPHALAALQAVVVEPGVRLFLSADDELRRRVDELTIEADLRQFADPEFRRELAHWIGEGAYGASWLLAKLGAIATRQLNPGPLAARRDAELLLSAPVFGVITAAPNTPTMQVIAGQAYERVHLKATALGLSMQPMNQALQVPAVKARLTGALPLGPTAPQVLFRLGYAQPEAEHTPRRPLEAVLM
ncbi:MAG: Acg family FMN-binding oxidoreductase [Thermoflexales bacterium]